MKLRGGYITGIIIPTEDTKTSEDTQITDDYSSDTDNCEQYNKQKLVLCHFSGRGCPALFEYKLGALEHSCVECSHKCECLTRVIKSYKKYECENGRTEILTDLQIRGFKCEDCEKLLNEFKAFIDEFNNEENIHQLLSIGF
jgi:hypothetical protein